MRLYLKTTSASPDGSFEGGQEYAVPGEIPQARADALVACGSAEWVKSPATPAVPAVETAAVEVSEPPVEKAAVRTKAPRGRRG